MLLVGTATPSAARIEATLQKAAHCKATTVACLAPLDADPGGEKRWNRVSIEELAQLDTQ
jgi:hypothetical protein